MCFEKASCGFEKSTNFSRKVPMCSRPLSGINQFKTHSLGEANKKPQETAVSRPK